MIKEGILPLERDDRDFTVGALFQLPKLKDLPEEYLVEPLSIKDQNSDGNYDFCAGCAGTGMIEPKEGVELFYPFLWAAAKFESGTDVNSFGVDLRSVGKALCKWGVPEIKDIPDSVKNLSASERRIFANYPPSVRDAARKHLAQSYMFVDGPYDAYDNARANIWKFKDEKRHILFGVAWNWNPIDFELTGVGGGSGHAMWLGGWFKNGLCSVNSIGVNAGHKGVHSISRETYNKWADVYGALIIVDKPREDIEYAIQNHIKEGDSWLSQILKVVWTIFSSVWLTNKEKADTIRNSADTLNEIADKVSPRYKEALVVEKYKWGNPTEVRHSCRLIMDEYNLAWKEKDLLCAVIQAESGFNPKAINGKNTNGTKDYGLVQVNDKWWIGPGRYFASVEEVLNNPEKSVRFIVEQYKAGNLRWWCAFTNNSYKKYL